MVRGRVLAPLIPLLLMAAGCSGTTDERRAASAASRSPSPVVLPSPTEPSCPAPSVSLQTTAKDVAFDKGCLVVPAHRRFTVRFTNADKGVSHNFAIHGPALAETYLKGKTFLGVKSITLKARALEPGEYLFHCDVHPSRMNGTLWVTG